MSARKFNTVEDYLTALDPVKAMTITSVFDVILAEFPGLESKIAWNVPQIHRNGEYVAGLAAYKNHLTYSPWSTRVLDGFRVRLGTFVVFKNCFQLPAGWEVDKALVKDLVRARLAELD